MNLESLKFYIEIIRAVCGATKEEMISKSAEALDYLKRTIDENLTPAGLARQVERFWHRAGEPIKVEDLAIDPRLYTEAVLGVFGETASSSPAEQSSQTLLLDGYVNSLRSKRGDEDADNTGMDVREIWDRVEYVLRQPENQNRAYGLAVGRVQSGKTQNYIGLILRARDAGWNTIILLTSKNKLLAMQTEDRIRKAFDELDVTVNWLSSPTRDGRGVQFNTNASWDRSSVNFGLALKDHNHIDWVNQWLVSHAVARPQMKILIIDDESDYATPDGRLVGGVRIEDDATVLRMAEEIELDRSERARVAAQWVRGLVSDDHSWKDDEKRTIRDFCEHTTVKTLNADLQGNGEVMRILGFVNADGTYREVDGRRQLFDSVMNPNTFARKIRRTNSGSLVHAKAFIALLRYVADYRPAHSVINAAMRVMAGRPYNPAEQSANDVRPYTYEKMAYVAYTATPYANLLNENPMRDPLAPDFIKSLRTSRKYIGFGQIFGARPMNIVENISSEEAPLLENLDSSCPVNGDPVSLTFTVENPNHGAVEIDWKSLKRALAWFVCSAAARRAYRLENGRENGRENKRETRWTTMILNVSYEQGNHSTVVNWVSKYLETRMSSESQSAAFKEECLAVWRELKGKFTSEDFRESFAPRLDAPESGYPVAPRDYPPDDKLKESLEWFLARPDHIKVVQINSSEEGHDGADDYYNEWQFPCDDVAWVLCGGNVISRGLTLEGLTTSYFNRIGDTTSVDTITQMGRWFGYREGYELLPRLWMMDDTKKEMGEFARIEDRMHNMVRSLFERTEPCFDDNGNVIDERPLSPIIDRDKFGILITFGRRLSGRDNAAVNTTPPGLGSILDSLDEFVRDNAEQKSAMTAVGEVGNRLTGEFSSRRLVHNNTEAFGERYHRFPYWKNIEKSVVLNLLQRIGSVYPAGSEAARKRASLATEISQKSDRWDIVFANPETHEAVDGVLDGSLHGHQEKPTEGAYGREIAFKRKHTTATGFLAAVDLRDVNLAECSLVEALKSRMDFSELERVLNLSIDAELRRVRENPRQKLNALLRNNRYFNFSKNSHLSQDYLDKVFELHQKRTGIPANPILLIDFVRPSGEGFEGFGYYPVLSYYWHGHESQDYWLVTAGIAPSSIRLRGDANREETKGSATEGSNPVSANKQPSSMADPEAAINAMKERIRKAILFKPIAEPRLKKAILSESPDREADYEQAICSFTPINKGIEYLHTPLKDSPKVFANSEQLEKIVRLQMVNSDEYLRQLTGWLTSRVDEEVKEHHKEGLNKHDFIQFVQETFPEVFSGDGIDKYLWDHYESYFGNPAATSRYGDLMMQSDSDRLRYDPQA